MASQFDDTTTVQGTSDGDVIVEATDTWVATNNNTIVGGEGGSLPEVVISSHGTGAAVVPVVAMTLGSISGGASGKTDNFGYRYDVTIPAGGTVRVMLFSELSNMRAEALAAAPDFETLAVANTAGLLTGLTATQLTEIVNYGADADLDGVLDAVDAFPNDPSRSVAESSSSSGATSLPALFALLGVPALLRRRKNKTG